MNSKIDMSLDDIIQKNRVNRRPNQPKRLNNQGAARSFRHSEGNNSNFRRNNTGSTFNRFNNTNNRNSNNFNNVGNNRGFNNQLSIARPSSRIRVENLGPQITQEDLWQLFNGVGDLKKVVISLEANNLRTGSVEFLRHSDARQAMANYNGVALDGYPMRITLAQQQQPIQNRPMQSRISDDRVPNRQQNTRHSMPNNSRFQNNRPQNNNNNQQQRRRPNGGDNNSNQKKKEDVSAESLDADLDAFLASRED